MYDNSRVIEVDINEILPNRFQPRIQFDEEEILELSDSIKQHGVIQPLVVRTIGDKYEIIAGERRYKASVLAGKETVPVIVKNLNDKDSAEVALIENIQRKNLTPIEEALSYKKILDMGYITQENLASKLGKSQSSVANKIRLLNLSDEVQEALLENKISERHARSLLKLSTAKEQNEMLNRIITERLTVRKADEAIEKMKNNSSDEGNADTQKIKEKGEIDMNNNMFGIPNVPQAPQAEAQSFDIFGGVNQQPVTPVQNQVATPMTQQAPSFDIFGGNARAPQSVAPSMPESAPVVDSVQMPEMPSVAPVVPDVPTIPEIPTINVNSTPVVDSSQTMDTAPNMPIFNTVQEEQTIPPVGPGLPGNVTPIVAETPVAQQTMPEIPTMGGIQFDENGTVISTPTAQPVISTIEPNVPQTAPIMESPVVEPLPQMTPQSENLFSFGDVSATPVVEPVAPAQTEEPAVPEFKMPEPIIITDYSKQYDPVMPVTPENMVPTVDFKEVINAIRECSSKIEQYGFKIDVEEYDLTNLYQVIFKIEK